MPSPFPGMDPYLEAPEIWPDFHDHFASEISAELNASLPRPFHARLEMRPEVGLVEKASIEVKLQFEPIRHKFAEIRDSSQGHRLITLIEIVSPSNKRSGQDRRAYLKKQQEILDSNASLIEIDLLRAGDRLLRTRNWRRL